MKRLIIRYCAWHWKPKIRHPHIFYTSTICKQHLLQLRGETMWHNKREVAQMPTPEVQNSFMKQESLLRPSLDSVTTSGSIIT